MQSRREKPPLKWTGVLFAFAANLLLTTLADMVAPTLPFGPSSELLATVAAPLLAGAITAYYGKSRGAMHAFIGGMASVPVLALFIFAQNWQLALLAGGFCTIGGALTEIAMRKRSG